LLHRTICHCKEIEWAWSRLSWCARPDSTKPFSGSVRMADFDTSSFVIHGSMPTIKSKTTTSPILDKAEFGLAILEMATVGVL